MKAFIGLDPGVNGAAALVDLNGKPVDVLRFSKHTETDIWDWLTTQCETYQVQTIQLEFVSAWPKMGVVSAFTFGKGYGRLEAWIVAVGSLYGFPIPKPVHPRIWQAKMGCLSKGNKNVTKSRAQKLFPSMNIVHEMADSLLIAEYARLNTLGLLR